MKHSIVFLCLLSLLGCDKNEPKKQAVINEIATFPLTWYPGVNNLPLVESLPAAKTKTDLQQILKIKWHRTIDLIDSETEKETTVASIESCNDYLSKNIKGSEPIYREWWLYMRAVLRCEAVAIVIHGKDSISSNIGGITLDKTFADMLPIELSFVVAPDEEKVVLKNKGKSWSFFNEIKSFTKIDDYSAEYKLEDATQTITVLARGDFNSDKMEDLLLLVENSIDEGRYYPTRLFVITRDQGKSMFRLIKDYKLRSS